MLQIGKAILFLVIGFVFLIKGADFFVEGSSSLAGILKVPSVIIGLTCVLMPLVIICSIWESGYAIRYTADFSWPILIGALSIGFYLYRHTKNETWRKVARLCMGVAVPAALVLNFAHVYTFKFPSWVALDHFGVFHNLAELFTIF